MSKSPIDPSLMRSVYGVLGMKARAIATKDLTDAEYEAVVAETTSLKRHIILEDEKVMGTIHIAFGDNKSMGGSVRVASHLDGLVTRPSVWFDERPIMKDGRLLVD